MSEDIAQLKIKIDNLEKEIESLRLQIKALQDYNKKAALYTAARNRIR